MSDFGKRLQRRASKYAKNVARKGYSKVKVRRLQGELQALDKADQRIHNRVRKIQQEISTQRMMA